MDTQGAASTGAAPSLREQQLALTRHLRDPAHVPPPSGMEERRLAVYRDLLFNNIENLLAGNFPVIARVLGDAAWKALVRDFQREHRCRTPLFPEIAREFIRYLDSRPAINPPFLRELAHYEWMELALQLSEARVADVACDPAGDLLLQSPVVSPLAWPLAYEWPVHRIGPRHRPQEPTGTPTCLLLRREADGSVRFSELSPLAFRLLARLSEQKPRPSGAAQLRSIADEAGIPADEAFMRQGGALLEQMRATGVLLGTVPPDR